MYNSVMESNTTLKHRIDVSFFQIIGLDNGEQRKDLHHMWRHARNLWDLLDQELINCRRNKKRTVKYIELEKQLIEFMETIDQYLTFATLLVR